jgi:hypothetical protein
LLTAAATARPPATAPWIGRSGLDHRERDTPAVLVDLEHPHLDDLTDADDVVWIADELP